MKPGCELEIHSATCEQLEHPSDFGLRAISGRFETSLLMIAFGMLRSMFTLNHDYSRRNKVKIIKTVTAEEKEQCVVRFLQELLHLVYVDLLMPIHMIFRETADHMYECVCMCVALSETNDAPGTEIKAVTYHQLSIIIKDDNCSITVYFDI